MAIRKLVFGTIETVRSEVKKCSKLPISAPPPPPSPRGGRGGTRGAEILGKGHQIFMRSYRIELYCFELGETAA